MSENKLVEKAKGGDAQAFEKLYDMYAKKVYNLALRMSKNQEDALDLSQEILIKISMTMSI